MFLCLLVFLILSCFPQLDEDATVTIDDKLLARKITSLLKDGYTKRIGGGEFTGTGFSRLRGEGGSGGHYFVSIIPYRR